MRYIQENINWKEFMRNHDLVWESLPLRWEEAPFVGNGLVGTLMYGDENGIRFWVCRSDVGRLDYPGQGNDPIRIQIGTLDLIPKSKIILRSCRCRLDLWNAEVRGSLVTENGEIKWRLFAPSGGSVVVLDLESENEQWSWEPVFIPEGTYHEESDILLFHTKDYISHPRTKTPSGGFAVAWKEMSIGYKTKRFIFSVGSTPVNRIQWNKSDRGEPALQEAIDSVESFFQNDDRELLESHRKWWHGYYKKSFFSISDREIESFYWIQVYKFASSGRPDRPMIDNHAVWSVEKSYGFSTWDYNVQSTYRMHLTSNHRDFGEPFLRFLEDNFNENTMWNPKHGELRGGMRQQTFLRYCFFDTDNWEHASDLPCDGPAKFLWGCYNYWLHYLHAQDESMLPRLLVMLEGGINAMRAGMKEENGKLIIPSGYSWEYWKGKNPSGLLSVFKWALRTAVKIGNILEESQDKILKWQTYHDSVIDYPRGPGGYFLGEGEAPIAYRHWTHLMMIFPFSLIDTTDSDDMKLALESIDTWAQLSAGLSGNEACSFAPVAAIVLYAVMGKPGKIAQLSDIYLHTWCDRAPGVWANTMYREHGPVIETPLFFANAIQECCLMSKEDGVYVFSAAPDEWNNITFHNWHAAGNFLVSACREAGITRWVHIKSISGKKQRFYMDFKPVQKQQNVLVMNGAVEVTLKKGEEILLTNNWSGDLQVGAVKHNKGKKNSFGKNKHFYSARDYLTGQSKPNLPG